MRKGYIQVYTGSGKGKTTAALGLALRAVGAGLRVYIAQFIKVRRCSEHLFLERFNDQITIRQFGRGFFLKRKPNKGDIQAAQDGLRELQAIIRSKEYDVVILDEANVAVRYNLLSLNDLLGLMDLKPASTELIITGRYADDKVLEKADLVTEMRAIKHYREKGVKARRGIEC